MAGYYLECVHCDTIFQYAIAMVLTLAAFDTATMQDNCIMVGPDHHLSFLTSIPSQLIVIFDSLGGYCVLT